MDEQSKMTFTTIMVKMSAVASVNHFQSGKNCSATVNSLLLRAIKNRDINGLFHIESFETMLKTFTGKTIYMLDVGSADGLFLNMFTQKINNVVPNITFNIVCVESDPNVHDQMPNYKEMMDRGIKINLIKKRFQNYISDLFPAITFDLIMLSHVAYYLGSLIYSRTIGLWDCLQEHLSKDGLICCLTMCQEANEFHPRNDGECSQITLWNVEKICYSITPGATISQELAGKMAITARQIVPSHLSQYNYPLPDISMCMPLDEFGHSRTLSDLPQSFKELNEYEIDYLNFLTRSRFSNKFTDELRQDFYVALKQSAPESGVSVIHPCCALVIPSRLQF